MEALTQYRILNQLGSQKNRTFGNVYLLEHKETLTKAVLKHVKKATVKENMHARLRSEATFDFEAQGLPKTIYFQENDTEIVLIKEFFEGIPLDLFWNSIAKKERLTVLKSIFSQLSPLFQLLKDESIAHCDLKPSNIIVNNGPQGLSVAIIDFGMAIRYRNKERRALLFPMGYAAPELLLNELELIDQRSDFYSLGICIWRLYENKLPLTHPNPSVFTNLQLNHPTPNGENLPKELMKLVLEMTSKYSFERPPNQLEARERLVKLKIGIDQRPKSFEEIVERLHQVTEKKWFFF